MRILFVFTFEYSLETWLKSGTLEKEIKLFKELYINKGVKFTFLTYGNEKDLNYDLSSFGIEVMPIFKNKRVPNTKILLALYSIYFSIKNRKKMKHINIIQQNQLNGSWLSIIMKLILRKPLILRTGYDTYRFSVLEKKSKIKKLFFLILTNLNFIICDLYTVTSKSDKKYSEKYFFSPKKIYIRPNWVNKNNLVDLNKRDSNKILTVGRLENQKNYIKLLSDFKDTDFELDIVGIGSEIDNLKTFAKDYNVNANFLGRIENNDLEEMYKKYIFYISTSTFEGNPKTILEAMSNGCIVLISDIENHKELIINEENGYLLNLNSNFKNKIEELLIDLPALSKVSKNAKNFVEENNLINKLIDSIYSDYKLLSN